MHLSIIIVEKVVAFDRKFFGIPTMLSPSSPSITLSSPWYLPRCVGQGFPLAHPPRVSSLGGGVITGTTGREAATWRLAQDGSCAVRAMDNVSNGNMTNGYNMEFARDEE
ncbi:hypothetical protein DEO72_LG8g2929 [Vigna unguiculata]|uniref:Uncharacterized protein n=1 Tax=Vigna unguiculata TaxID=3917 RepID=A0A4D6MUS8_VIGUN|nr:hypothetical protein DEO72_LG8g2929 [Vigna unguiculata]